MLLGCDICKKDSFVIIGSFKHQHNYIWTCGICKSRHILCEDCWGRCLVCDRNKKIETCLH